MTGQQNNSILGGMVQGAADGFATMRAEDDRFNALPAYEKGVHRAANGLWEIVFSSFLGLWWFRFFGDDFGNLPTWAWCAAGVIGIGLPHGLLSLAVGIKAPRGPREIMGAAKALVIAAVFGAGWWWQVHIPTNGDQFLIVVLNICISGICIASVIAGLTRAFLLLRGPGNESKKITKLVKEQKVRGNADFVDDDERWITIAASTGDRFYFLRVDGSELWCGDDWLSSEALQAGFVAAMMHIGGYPQAASIDHPYARETP